MGAQEDGKPAAGRSVPGGDALRLRGYPIAVKPSTVGQIRYGANVLDGIIRGYYDVRAKPSSAHRLASKLFAGGYSILKIVVVPLTSFATTSRLSPVGLSEPGTKSKPSGPRSPAVPALGSPLKSRLFT